jgi:hypothetical protein
MPIERREDETRDEFVSRCVSKEMNGGMPQDQALAVCLTYADEYFKGATKSVTDNTWSTEAPINTNLSKVKKVIFDEEFNEDDVKKYKDLGFKVYIRSSRKIKKKDKKVWNKLKVAGLSEDNLVFGELKELNKKYEFDLLLTGQDPILEALLLKGQELNLKNVISSYEVDSIEDAKLKEEIMLKSVDLKFVTVKVLYTYEEIPGIPPAASGSRNFCKRMLSNNRAYSLDEISNLPNEHLKEMFKKYDLQPDVFQYRGGFYRLPGTLNTTPWCRHYWKANVVVS